MEFLLIAKDRLPDFHTSVDLIDCRIDSESDCRSVGKKYLGLDHQLWVKQKTHIKNFKGKNNNNINNSHFKFECYEINIEYVKIYLRCDVLSL